MSARCSECGESHCYWCGLPFPYTWKPSHPARPTKEHLLARMDFDGRIDKGKVIVIAHNICNSTRGHAPWVPFHSRQSGRPRAQLKAAHRVHLVLNGKATQ